MKFIFFLFLFLFSFNFAYAGIVPCGPGTGQHCTFCHLLLMISNLVNFIYGITFLLAVLMVVIGGLFMIIAYISPDAGGEPLTRARSIFKATAIGLLIVYGGWIILNAFLIIIGVDPDWWIITC